jgi:hypothetical protein
MKRSLTPEQVAFVEKAVEHLEFPSLVVRITHQLGKPLEQGIGKLPGPVRGLVTNGSRKAIEKALGTALETLPRVTPAASFDEAARATRKGALLHGAGSAAVGAVGGFFGLPALVLELPVVTTVLLRSMAEIAGRFGEPLDDRRVQLECLSLFSYGAPSEMDDAVESAYFGARLGFAALLDQSMKYVAGKTAAEILRAVQHRSAPALVSFIVKIATRFEIVVGEKALAQLLPGIGAGAGAAINLAFSEHYTQLARCHFGLRRLERECGESAVRDVYERARRNLVAARAKKR